METAVKRRMADTVRSLRVIIEIIAKKYSNTKAWAYILK